MVGNPGNASRSKLHFEKRPLIHPTASHQPSRLSNAPITHECTLPDNCSGVWLSPVRLVKTLVKRSESTGRVPSGTTDNQFIRSKWNNGRVYYSPARATVTGLFSFFRRLYWWMVIVAWREFQQIRLKFLRNNLPTLPLRAGCCSGGPAGHSRTTMTVILSTSGLQAKVFLERFCVIERVQQI